MSSLSSSELSQIKIIEEEVNKYLRSKQNDPRLSTGINSALNRVIPRTLMPTKKVNIVWNSDARKPFIMSITPDISELYKASEEINKMLNDNKVYSKKIIDSWCDIKEWHIEIDTRVLTKGNILCVDDGSQFVALLCHEIGHVMMENPVKLMNNYKNKSLQYSTLEKLMLSNSRIVRSIMLPMYTHTLQFMVITKGRKESQVSEINADLYVPDEYKASLVSYINNHILLEPDTNCIIIDEETFDKEQEIGIQLSRDSVEMLRGRRDLLNKQIQSQYNSPNSSTFHKKLMMFIGKNLTGYNPDDDKYITGLKSMMENAYNKEYETMEALSVSILTEASKITNRELDVLDIQAEDIHTPEDKMYMIHKVYDYIEAVSAENNKKMKHNKNNTVIKDERLDRLIAIRTKVLQTNVSASGDKYGVFVKYPAGYEG